jgi:NADH:ubiquinone reductase (H+-translocating)
MKNSLPRIVIVGAGFGGLRAARALRNLPVNVVVVDRHNYHLFQPLLYQVATAGLSPDEIAYPVRAILRHDNVEFRLAEVTGVNLAERRLSLSTGELNYDYLILAFGSQTSYFNLDSVQQHGFGLKEIEDAVHIRNHVLWMFELAAQESDPQKRAAELTFVVVGGGPTGVEMAGALSELTRLVLAKDYAHHAAMKSVRIILLEAMESILATMPPSLQSAAHHTLERKQVEVRFGAAVQDYDGEVITLKSGERIPACTLIWAAGVQAASLADKLGLPQARQGRIVVSPTLQVPEHPEIFVIGDAAYLEMNGAPLPMLAPVAIQQAESVAQNIRRALRGEPPVKFFYSDPGSLATIGRNAAVARLGRLHWSGFPAWVMWLVVHILQLIGFRNRLVVLINWAWDYFLYERAVRLIAPE